MTRVTADSNPRSTQADVKHIVTSPPIVPQKLSEVSLSNIRDFHDALPTIQPGRVIRCAKPSDATAVDTAYLVDVIGIRDLIDLRSLVEVKEDPPDASLFKRVTSPMITYPRRWLTGGVTIPPLPSEAFLLHHQLSLLEKSRYYTTLLTHISLFSILKAILFRLMGFKEASRQMLVKEVNAGGLGLFYKMTVDSAKPEILGALTLVTRALEKRRPVLIFCKAGKDRTGIVSMLVLWCAGATTQQIIDDYIKSDRFHKVALAGIEDSEELRGLDKGVFERAPPEAMETLLKFLEDKYGGVGKYLSSIGFSEQEQKTLRTLMTTPSSDTI